MPTHSSILAWSIPWTEEPGPQGFERAEYDLATKQQLPLTNTYCFVFYAFPPLVFHYETFQTGNWKIVL